MREKNVWWCGKNCKKNLKGRKPNKNPNLEVCPNFNLLKTSCDSVVHYLLLHSQNQPTILLLASQFTTVKFSTFFTIINKQQTIYQPTIPILPLTTQTTAQLNSL